MINTDYLRKALKNIGKSIGILQDAFRSTAASDDERKIVVWYIQHIKDVLSGDPLEGIPPLVEWINALEDGTATIPLKRPLMRFDVKIDPVVSPPFLITIFAPTMGAAEFVARLQYKHDVKHISVYQEYPMFVFASQVTNAGTLDTSPAGAQYVIYASRYDIFRVVYANGNVKDLKGTPPEICKWVYDNQLPVFDKHSERPID